MDEAVESDSALYLTDQTVISTTFPIEEAFIQNILQTAIEPTLFDSCPLEVASENIQEDTVLLCNDVWQVDLPDAAYIWEDGSSENPRILQLPGNYRATKTTCLEDKTVEYQLTKEDCSCPVYVPNVIQPDGDGMNDELEIFSACTITKIEMSIYDRWGELLFLSNSMNQFWQGDFNGKRVNSGVYILHLEIEMEDGVNGFHQIEKYQTITVL